jgi:hypothetical protein
VPRLTAGQWSAARAEYESGASLNVTAERHHISRRAVQNRAKEEGWTQDVEPLIRQKLAEKIAGIVAGGDPEKKAAAVDAEAQRRMAVVSRHKREWDEHQLLIAQAIADQDFEFAKLAKITSETIRIRQDGERKAWGLDDAAIKIDVSRASDEELANMAKGRG